MPKLFQINTVANWGSTGRIAEGIGEAASRSGWTCWMAYGRGRPESRMRLVPVGSKWDMYRNGALARLLDNEGLNAHRATRRLIATMRELEPDVVHLHNIHGYYLNYPRLFSYLAEAGMPVVWTLHDCWPLTGHCTHFDFLGCDRWKTECSHCPQLKEYPASLWLDGSRRNFALKKQAFNRLRNLTLVPVSDWLADLTRQSHLGGHAIRRIHNGVDLQRFRPLDGRRETVREKLGISAPHYVLGVASTWTARKGLSDFVALRALLPADKVQIVLLGLTAEQARQLPAGVIGLRRTDSIEEMVGLYSAAAAFVNPTWEDNFPTTNLEALACGTPVITYRTGGSVEAVDTATGLVIRRGDIPALATAVKQVCSRPDPETMRKACRERAECLYNREDRFAEYVRLYEDLRGNP